jgi:hypothetical protein
MLLFLTPKDSSLAALVIFTAFFGFVSMDILCFIIEAVLYTGSSC